MKVRDIIVTPVTTITTDSDVATARDLMNMKKISVLPVVDVDVDTVEVEGIVSQQDLNGVYDDNIQLSQIMTTKIFAVDPNLSVQRAAEIMLDKKIHHLIVMENDDLIGIISSMDMVKIVAEGE